MIVIVTTVVAVSVGVWVWVRQRRGQQHADTQVYPAFLAPAISYIPGVPAPAGVHTSLTAGSPLLMSPSELRLSLNNEGAPITYMGFLPGLHNEAEIHYCAPHRDGGEGGEVFKGGQALQFVLAGPRIAQLNWSFILLYRDHTGHIWQQEISNQATAPQSLRPVFSVAVA
ncbi:MAG: hypothetical protein SF053_06375 [Bacteroidia bacterium]|nr:hypothetical protein [Bacteroidia bacterium]